MTSPHSLSQSTFDAVLLDLDGTLVDSVATVTRSWLRWADEEGLDPFLLNGFHGVPSSGIVAALLPGERRSSALARIDALELADVDGVVALPGAARALAALPSGRAAIATSCGRDLAAARIAAAGLVAPAVVVTVDDVENGKPAPDPYFEAARRLGMDPSRCLVVEDAPSGLLSAKAAGCATLAVTTTMPPEDLDADLVVATLDSVRFVASPGGLRVELV